MTASTRVGPPPPPRENLAFFRGRARWLWLACGVAAVLFIFSSSQGQTRPAPVELSQFSYTVFTNADMWLEYSGDTYFRYKIDLTNYHGANAFDGAWIRAGFRGGDHPLQLCNSQDCGDGQTGANNHFDGDRTQIPQVGIVSWSRGGTLETGDTDYWVKLHPTYIWGNSPLTRKDTEHRYEIKKTGHSTIADNIKIKFRDIGFRGSRPNLEPRKGQIGEFFISWANPRRYVTDVNGLVATNAATKAATDRPTFWVEYTDDPADPDANSLTVDQANRIEIADNRYHTLVGPLSTAEFPADTELWVRLRYQETRIDNNYDLYSNTSRFFLPASLETATREGNNIKVRWEDTYSSQTQDIDKWEYRIGSGEGSDTIGDPGFHLQTVWSTSDWIEVCETDLGEEIDSGTTYITLTITGPESQSDGSCGADTDTDLLGGEDYRVQLRGTDEQRSENQIVRNLLNPDLVQLPIRVPSQPLNFRGSHSHQTVTLNWDQIQNNGATITQTQYRYKETNQAASDWSAWTTVDTANPTVTTLEIDQLTNGTSYDFQIRGVNSSGDGLVSETVAVTPNPLRPSRPSIQTTYAAGYNWATIFWAPIEDNGAPLTQTQYRFHIGTAEAEWTEWQDLPNPTQNFATMTGEIYFGEMQVRAVNSSGTGPTAERRSILVYTAPRAPARPLNLQPRPADGQITLTWNAIFGNGASVSSTKYRQKQTSQDDTQWGVWTEVHTSNPTATNLTLTGLTNGTSYDLQIRGANTHGDGDISDTATAIPSGLPSKPANLQASASANSVTLSWAPIANNGGALISTQYRYKRTSQSNTSWGDWTEVDPTNPTATTLTRDQLENGVSYDFQVRGENPAGQGAVSDRASAMPVGPPAKPAGVSVRAGNQQLTVSWSISNGGSVLTSTEYRIKQTATTTWGDWTEADTNDATATSLVLDSLDNGVSYDIQIRGENTHGQGEASDTTSGTPDATTPAPTPTSPPVTQPPPTPTLPPATTPTIPSTTPTIPSITPTSPPATNPPSPPAGGGNTVVTQTAPDGNTVQIIGDNNTVIIGDGNTIVFTDTEGNVHEQNIISLADMGVTRGCNPPENSRFCPNRAVTRAEMATFLTRAFELDTTSQDPFGDTAGNVHRTNINRMAAAGISRGCNPPTNDEFCPDRAVTRAEMATFMTRVLELEEEGTGFDDTTGNVHATNIRRFAEAGITRGCNPPQNSRYCPDRAVTRAEMATFLVRATNLDNG